MKLTPACGSAKVGGRAGWGPLAQGARVAYQTKTTGPDKKNLTVGRVLINHREERRLTVQPYKGVWKQVRVAHAPRFQTRDGYSSVGADIAKENVLYQALVLQVELLVGGELRHSSARLLEVRG